MEVIFLLASLLLCELRPKIKPWTNWKGFKLAIFAICVHISWYIAKWQFSISVCVYFFVLWTFTSTCKWSPFPVESYRKLLLSFFFFTNGLLFLTAVKKVETELNMNNNNSIRPFGKISSGRRRVKHRFNTINIEQHRKKNLIMYSLWWRPVGLGIVLPKSLCSCWKHLLWKNSIPILTWGESIYAHICTLWRG